MRKKNDRPSKDLIPIVKRSIHEEIYTVSLNIKNRKTIKFKEIVLEFKATKNHQYIMIRDIEIDDRVNIKNINTNTSGGGSFSFSKRLVPLQLKELNWEGYYSLSQNGDYYILRKRIVYEGVYKGV